MQEQEKSKTLGQQGSLTIREKYFSSKDLIAYGAEFLGTLMFQLIGGSIAVPGAGFICGNAIARIFNARKIEVEGQAPTAADRPP